MKLLMFREGNERRLGVVRDGSPEEVVDVSQLAKGNGSSGAPSDVLALIESGNEGLQRLRELEAEGVVGRVAEEHYGFGLAPDPEPLLVSAREVARRLREAQVDLALLVPA